MCSISSDTSQGHCTHHSVTHSAAVRSSEASGIHRVGAFGFSWNNMVCLNVKYVSLGMHSWACEPVDSLINLQGDLLSLIELNSLDTY